MLKLVTPETIITATIATIPFMNVVKSEPVDET